MDGGRKSQAGGEAVSVSDEKPEDGRSVESLRAIAEAAEAWRQARRTIATAQSPVAVMAAAEQALLAALARE